MKRSRSAHAGSSGSTRSTAPYRTATMSVIEKMEPTCELFPALVMRSAWMRRRFASDVVAAVRFDLVVLVHVEVTRIGIRRRRQQQLRHVAEQLVVQRGQLAAALDDLRVVLELEIQHRGLEVVEPRVEPPLHHLARLLV